MESVKSRWHSERIGGESLLCRWGHHGQPVLVFPTAGGDAEEIERMLVIRVLTPLIEAGRIKVYSCDSVGGRVWFSKEGTPEHRMALQHGFHQYLKHEVVPAIRGDCGGDPELTVWAAGASIGAFHAVAMVCRFPDLFSRALGMSGTYDIMRFCEATTFTEEFFVSSPLLFVKTLEGPHLEKLRERFICLATGEGRWENIGESWKMANALGAQSIPNRVDSWGKDADHDWPTWRAMLPKYLDEWTRG